MSTMSFAPGSIRTSNVRTSSVARSARPAPMSQRRSSALRLTRRGRMVVVGAALAGLVALGGVATEGASAALHGGRPVAAHQVTVMPGDTLWDLAAKAAAGGDILAMEQRIMELNALGDASLHVGQRLLVPAS